MKNIHSEGFTLVEMLVALALASIVISALLGAFITFLQYQSISQDERNALESVRFMLSDISRDLHFGHDYVCAASVANTNQCTCLAFTDQIGRRVKIRHTAENGRVEKSIKLLDTKPDSCEESDPFSPLTDNSVTINTLFFEIVDSDDEQPRVRIKTSASYEVDGEEETVDFKTQVTRRVLEASQDIASDLSIGERSSSNIPGGFVYYIYKREGNDVICVDENGNESEPDEDNGGRTFCDSPISPIAAEFTEEALYVLGDNGLIFAIPVSEIVGTSGAIAVTGDPDGEGSGTARDIPSSTIGSAITRVIGKSGSSGCRGCSDDPSDIIALYPTERVLYAKSSNGALYTIQKDGSIFAARKILSGGVSTNSLKHIAVDSHRVFTLFRNTNGRRVLRLYTKADSDDGLTVEDMRAGDINCPEFRGIPTISDSCFQIKPDPIPDSASDPNDPTNSVSVSPSALDSIELTSTSRLQFFENTSGDDVLGVWYRSSGASKGISVVGGQASTVENNSVTEGGEIERSSGGQFTFICQGGEALCGLSNISRLTPSGISASLGSGVRVLGHLWFPYTGGSPIGYTNDGRLVYFQDDISSAHIDTVYDSASGKVFCDTLPENGQQVSFSYLSEQHPNEEVIALIGRIN